MTSTPDVLVVDHSDNDAEITLLGIRQAAPHATSLRLRDGDQALQFMFCRDGFAGRVPRIPQLVFLEAELPARHALDVLNELHLGGLAHQTSVFILASTITPGMVERSYSLGAKGCVVKPIEIESYCATVRELVDRWMPSQGTFEEHRRSRDPDLTDSIETASDGHSNE